MHAPRRLFALLTLLAVALPSLAAAEPRPLPPANAAMKARLDKALDSWCRWLSGYLYQVPGTDYYTMNPTLGTGPNPYRDVAGNTFAAAAVGYWLKDAKADESVKRPLLGLVRLMLDTHIAVKGVDRPDIQMWGATLSHSDNWHADLFAVAMAMLMWDRLPAEDQAKLQAILTWEADKQVEYGISVIGHSIPGIQPNATHGEANAWSSAICQAARVLMPGSPRDEAWRTTAMDYALNAICMPKDITSEEVVGGRKLKDVVKGANFHPGGTQEHHGFYHPGYMGWPLGYMAYAHVLDEQLPEGRRNPDVYLHNWKYVFDRMSKGTFENGRFVHAAGDDWITYGYGNTQFYPAAIFAAAHYQDRFAARLADEWIKMIELQQAAGKGCILEPRLATFQRLHMNDFSWYEGQEGCALAQAIWLLERLGDRAIPAPATAAEYNAAKVDTYHEPGSKLAWYRDERTWASASWRAFRGWQFMVQPVGLPHLLRHNENGQGLLEVSGTNPGTTIEWDATGIIEGGGFWSMGSLGRLSKKVTHSRPNNTVAPLVRQRVALAALANGPVILVDTCQALDQIWILHEGSLGLRLAADIFNGGKFRLAAAGGERTFGPSEGQDTWHDLGNGPLTVEGTMVIQPLGNVEGTWQLLQKRGRSPNRDYQLSPSDVFGTEESLFANELYYASPACKRPKIVSPGETFRKTILAFYCDPKTAADALTSMSPDGSKVTVGLPGQPSVTFDFNARTVECRR